MDSRFAIRPGDKWAAICYSGAWCRELADETNLGNSYWVLTKCPIELPGHWKEWIGSIRANLIENANLWLVSKARSDNPAIMDDEVRQLMARATTLSLALHTAVPVEFEFCFNLNGGNVSGDSMVRGFDEYPRYMLSWRLEATPVGNAEVSRVEEIREGLSQIFMKPGFIRIRRGFNAFWRGLKDRDPEDRIHQFVRSLDAVVSSKGNVEFGQRAATFAGVAAESDLAECYRVRSKTEHLADVEDALPTPPAQPRDEHVLRRVRQMEMLCRTVYTRIATSPAHRDLFRDDDIKGFWKKPPDEQNRLWGEPFDIDTVQ